MLAQNFKTPEQLKIKPEYFEALCLTLVYLETNKLKHTPVSDADDARQGKAFTGGFNMATWNLGDSCGTVACIGGTAELLGGFKWRQLLTFARGNDQLYKLFFPENWGSYEDITTQQAALALRSYLSTGEANWEMILG